MTYRDREKARLVPLKSQLFSAEACDPGIYRGKRRDFCLWNDFSAENLHASIRRPALDYFAARGIGWHDGVHSANGFSGPSHHLCCSQTFCVNTWFPFRREGQRLAEVLRAIGFPVGEMLPVESDQVASGPLAEGPDAAAGAVAFEWIGARNYLAETSLGQLAADEARRRGAGFTSADFAFRYRRTDGKIEVVLGEWKYTEEYPRNHSILHSESGTDRLAIYRNALEQSDCPIRLEAGLAPDALFYDPFDQLMRLQLLAGAMEREKEMGADRVSVLHISPRANQDLNLRITSPSLVGRGETVHDVWKSLVRPERFRGVHFEDLLPVLVRNAPDEAWGQYMQLRYA